MDTVPEKPSDMIGYGLPRPGSQVQEAFNTNMQKLGKSVQSAFSTGDDILGNELAVLKQDIDAGRVPENAQDWGHWLDQRNDRLKQAQTRAYTSLEGDTPENRAFAESNSLLGNPRHGALLLDYLQTRDPAVFDELRKNVSLTPGRAKLEDQQQRLAKDSNLAKLMNSTFGEGAGNYIIEAGDPLEVAGNLLPMFKGAKLVKALKGGSKLKAAGEAITGAVGETASELGSQFMDDPTASWDQRLQVAKDAFIGSLGLGGLGAGAQMVRDRFVPPPVDAANPPASASAERKPSDDLPPQSWTPRGQTMADMPPGAELTYDDQGRVSGWEAPVANRFAPKQASVTAGSPTQAQPGTAPASDVPGDAGSTPAAGASILAQVAARGGQYDAPLSESPSLPASESPTLNSDLDTMPESGAELVYDTDGSPLGWVPLSPSPSLPVSPSRILTPENDPIVAALAAQDAAMPESPAASQGETIVAAAVVRPDGTVFTGRTHRQADPSAPADRAARETGDYGFVAQAPDGSQRFVSREEALQIARQSGQLRTDARIERGRLHSDQLAMPPQPSASGSTPQAPGTMPDGIQPDAAVPGSATTSIPAPSPQSADGIRVASEEVPRILASRPFPTAGVAAHAAAVAQGQQPAAGGAGLNRLFHPLPGVAQNPGRGAQQFFQAPVPPSPSLPVSLSPADLVAAHAAAMAGSSTPMVPIRAVFEQAQRLAPALTQEQFTAAVKQADNDGSVLLEAANSRQELDQAQGFVVPDAMGGPGIRMMMAPQRVSMSKSVPPGTGKTSYSRIREGDSFQAVRPLMQQVPVPDVPQGVTGSEAQMREQVGQMLGDAAVIQDAEGRPVLMQHEDHKGGGGLAARVWHLLAGFAYDSFGRAIGSRKFDPRRARTVLSTPATIQDYHLLLDTGNGGRAYVRRYADGTEHAVQVVPIQGHQRVVAQGTPEMLGLETQYPLDSRGIKGARVLRVRTPNAAPALAAGMGQSSAGPSAIAGGVVPGTPGPGSTQGLQTEAAPHPSGHGQPKTGGGEVKPSQAAAPAARLTPTESARRATGAAKALQKIQRGTPWLGQRVTLLRNRESLNESDFHPEDWHGFGGSTEGFFDEQSGHVVILTDNIALRPGESLERAVLRVIVHERTGHAGLAALRQSASPKFQQQWQKLMAAIENDAQAADEIAALRERGSGYDHLTSDDALVEEWFAKRAEQMTPEQIAALKPESILGKLWRFLKDLLQSFSRHELRSTWTNREVLEVLRISREALERGGPRATANPRGVRDRPFAAGARPAFIVPLAPQQSSATFDRHGTDPAAAHPSRNPRLALEFLQRQDRRADPRAGTPQRAAEPTAQPGHNLETAVGGAAQAAIPSLDAAAFATGTDALEQKNGDEHLVWHDEATGRAVKITRPGALKFGLESYLERMAFGNEAFKDDVRIEGWLTLPDGARQLVTSQPWIDGDQSTLGEIDAYMRHHGFLKARDGVWHRSKGDVWITDALDKNFRTDDSGHVHPIDFLMPELSDRQADQFEDLIEKQPQPAPPPLLEPERITPAKVGETLRHAESTLVEETPQSPLLSTRASNEQIARAAAAILQAWPATTTAADGTGIDLQVAERGSLAARVWHLIRDEKTQKIDPDKAAWLPRVKETLENAQVRLIDEQTGNRVYVRKYHGGIQHAVIIRPDGRVESQQAFTGSLTTQFPLLTNQGRQWKMRADWVRPDLENGSGLRQNAPSPTPPGSAVSGPRQGAFQNQPTPTDSSRQGPGRVMQSAAHLPPLWDYNARPANSNHGNASLNEVIASGVQGGRARNLKLQVGTVPEGWMQAGKFVWMDDSFVTHALGEHGDERREDTQGQEALTAADFAMIPHVVSAPDAVTPNEAAGGKKGVRFEKRVNGTLVFVTAEPNAKGQLRAVTMWKRRVGRVMPSKAPASTSATGSLTPGGANATPQDRAERSFGKRVRADERLDPQMREHFGDPIVYDVAHNADTLAAANDFISQHGLQAAADTFFDQRQPMPPHVRVTLGQQLLLRLDQAARTAMKERQAEQAIQIYDLAAKVSNHTDELGTQAGQTVQAFAMWTRMTPEGLLRLFTPPCRGCVRRPRIA
ncbi:MAG: hypothetical protein JNM65_00025 [Verrucomicrobiaceae bacterium]|nr:hypothetical protein [Verrucomicrobiaceae bacterium]